MRTTTSDLLCSPRPPSLGRATLLTKRPRQRHPNGDAQGDATADVNGDAQPPAEACWMTTLAPTLQATGGLPAIRTAAATADGGVFIAAGQPGSPAPWARQLDISGPTVYWQGSKLRWRRMGQSLPVRGRDRPLRLAVRLRWIPTASPLVVTTACSRVDFGQGFVGRSGTDCQTT